MSTRLFDLLKPFLRLALAAFVIGFGSYLALGGARAPAHPSFADAGQAAAPASEDWNRPRRI
ncbi:hypothetical protein LJR225_003628 [Phenylobacterium sp. LjRoot225]|uniref:hypothetical protein n=1 Tax=Phenylobacterium sp. LjRoot225 TaxID=3342285 RepID=UPI003ECF263B